MQKHSSVCLASLWGYSIQLHQSIDQVAKIALVVSLARAKSTEEFVKATEEEVVKDCLGHINDSVEQLSQAVWEIEHIGRNKGDEGWICRASNLQTIVGASIIDGNNYLDGF
ncbi:hypothetical protein Vadar_014622 [Vaccinium darrowii]|uniref:Uncharacterized protein n=1 Tax=Vaccinium darrowii TaxID=229202 RepID=A0ACB7ZCK8_9ERIC|nr:hypothetical protein Vadar_014622 [Vaccinium darrowii]